MAAPKTDNPGHAGATMSPDLAPSLRAAEGHLRAGRVVEGIAAFRGLLAVAPDLPDAWYNLAWLERQDRQFEAALRSYGEAIARGLTGAEAAYVNRAVILADHLDRIEDAAADLRQATRAAPGFVPAWLNLGMLEEDRGHLPAARAAYEAVLRLAPENGRARARLVMLDLAEGAINCAEERLATAPRAQMAEDRIETGFARAAVLDARGNHGAAFTMLATANADAQRLAGPEARYDAVAQERLTDAIIQAFPAAAAQERPDAQAPQPLFVCGMFRSGSTLCETVLARHTRITMGGELDYVPAMIAKAKRYPDDFAPLPEARIAQYRAEYLDALAARFPEAQLVTDKRPDNLLHIGLIKTLFPAARIVITERDPRDTALSILFLYFEDSVRYGARLEDIAHYMRCHARLVAHWRKIYGKDIAVFDYDRFVAEPDGETRKLFAALSLEWSDQCAPRPATPDVVRTPSAWAVRGPVHARSSGRWRHYEKQLAPFLAALHG
jgi:tetratricopeptide (TPR) repeat protein